MTLKIAVFAPIAIARVATVTTANPGARRRLRAARIRSLVQASSQPRIFHLPVLWSL